MHCRMMLLPGEVLELVFLLLDGRFIQRGIVRQSGRQDVQSSMQKVCFLVRLVQSL